MPTQPDPWMATHPWLTLVVGLVVGWILGYFAGRGQEGRRPGRHAPPVNPPAPGEMPDLEDLVRQGKKVDAIKLFRARTGAGLADAKAAVDLIEARQRST